MAFSDSNSPSHIRRAMSPSLTTYDDRFINNTTNRIGQRPAYHLEGVIFDVTIGQSSDQLHKFPLEGLTIMLSIDERRTRNWKRCLDREWKLALGH